MPRLAALALLLAALLSALASATAAAPRRPPLRPASVREPSTDGRGVTAWPDARDTQLVHVLRDDQPLSAASTVAIPGGCEFGAPSATALALVCTRADGLSFGELRTLDLAGHPLRTLDIGRLTTARANGEGYWATALGSTLAVLYGGGNHVSFNQYVRLDDGSVVDRGPDTPRTALDLDTPSGRAPMCAPLRRLTLRDPYVYRAPWLLELHRGRALLSRCGSARRRDLGSTYGRDLVLTRRYAAFWHGSGIVVRRFSDGATFRYPFPDLFAMYGGTDHRLWLSVGSRWYVIEP